MAHGQQQQQQQQQFITDLMPSDVLFGRGSGPNDHEGNVWFRQLVAERKSEYMATNHRMTKAKIAREIVDKVLAKNGRFLRKMEASDAKQAGLPEGVDAWILVDDDTIMEKAKQALRQNTSKLKAAAASPSGGAVTASPTTSSKAKLAPGSSVSCSSNSTNQSNLSQQRNHQHQQQQTLGPDIYEDFEPIPITTSSAVAAANMGGGNSYNQQQQQQQHEQQGTTAAPEPVSLQPSGRGNYYVVSPQTTAPNVVQNNSHQHHPQGLHVPSMAALGGMPSGMAAAAAALSSGDDSCYGVQQQQQQEMTPNPQTQYLSHLAPGPLPVAPWGSSDSGDYNTQQQQHQQDAPDVAHQQQQHHYQHQSQQQQQQQQNRYNQQQHPHPDHEQSLSHIPHLNHPHQREACNNRESLTIKEVFRLGEEGNNRRGSDMDMSDLMDSFRAAKLGTEDDMPEPDIAKKLMASTDTMGTIEQYTGGGTSYAEMSLATMNSSTFSFMKGDDSIDFGAKVDTSSPPNQQANNSSSGSGSSNNTASLAGRNIAVPTRPTLLVSSQSQASTSTSTIGVQSTDSSAAARVGGGLRESVGSVKSAHSDTSISISDLGPTAASTRRRSAGVSSSLTGVSEEHEAAFREEETQFSTTELDVDPLPLTAQTSGMSFGAASTTEALGNSSLSMLKGMLMSTDEMGAFQDDQQSPKGQNG